MPKWMKEVGIECFGLIMFLSTIAALAIIGGMFVNGIPIPEIEKLMSQWSIPWFVFWYFLCRSMRSIKIIVADEQDERSDNRADK